MPYTIPPNILKKLYSLQIRVVKFADTTGQISRYMWSNSPKYSLFNYYDILLKFIIWSKKKRVFLSLI